MKGVFHPGIGRCIAADVRFRCIYAFPRVKCKFLACFEVSVHLSMDICYLDVCPMGTLSKNLLCLVFTILFLSLNIPIAVSIC